MTDISTIGPKELTLLLLIIYIHLAELIQVLAEFGKFNR